MTPPPDSAAVVIEPAAAETTQETVLPASFTAAMEKAAAQTLSPVELLSAIDMLVAARQTSLIHQLYRHWLAHNPDHPARHLVCFNYGVMSSNSGDLAGARDLYLEAIALKKDFLPPLINLGAVLERMGATDQAVLRWYEVVNALGAVDGTAIAHKTATLKQIARVLEAARYEEHAEATLRVSLETVADQREPLQHWIWLRQGQCKWPILAPWADVTRKLMMETFYPLSLAAYADDPLFQLGTAYHYSKTDVGQETITTAGGWPRPEAPRPGPLRIGYVSSDLRGHAVGYLTSEIYELHDRKRVEVFAYYCGIKMEDATKARIRSTVDHWIDISDLSDRQAAQRIVADGIDILVDLNGYSKSGRTKLFALRPAPVIVNWLGYPGTIGSPYHHYIIADDYIIPPEHEIYYTEKVLRLPCYQANDRKRVIAAECPTRREAGLPEQGIVYCCFNGTQKITPAVFERWMTILSQVPDSVLWFLAGTEQTTARLRQAAAQYGIAPERLVFAEPKPNAEHVARFALADLLLDTWPYGAHTTASDALWMGVPVVTVSGRGFASRVCGSLVRAAGLGELVCDSFEQYVERAVALGRDKALVQSCKDRLARNRASCTLFDTPQLVRKLEALYAEMWEDYCRGALPVPQLTNLGLYHQVGAQQEIETSGSLSLTEYHERFRQGLAYHDSRSPLPADGRLWPSVSGQR
jgi:predicted O-linked N-acetylglucosamine transferase (SPINDLY family)